MGSSERRDSLQVESGSPWSWTAEEDELLVQLKKSKNRLESEESKNKLSRLYERGKSDIWTQIAAEMAVPWSEAERIHWIIGKRRMAKRGSDDSFRTTRVHFPSPQVDEAEVQAQRQQQQQHKGVGSDWSGDEETILFAYRDAKKSWKTISDHLPWRTVGGCRSHYITQNLTGPAWPQERKNELCKSYESLKRSIWSKIGERLTVRWEVAEDMHWRLGAAEMAERASVPLSAQTAFRLAPLKHDIDNAEVHQHRDQEEDQLSRHHHPPLSQTDPALTAHEARFGSSVTLPCFADFAAGVELPF
ncbi:hypothetical protein E4U28_001871 [Claviceps purpurea]|nr:hypothetical protein E4U28_001871 [Claviceps purpurea]